MRSKTCPSLPLASFLTVLQLGSGPDLCHKRLRQLCWFATAFSRRIGRSWTRVIDRRVDDKGATQAHHQSAVRAESCRDSPRRNAVLGREGSCAMGARPGPGLGVARRART
jgi:hypothetical protein